MFSSSRDRVDRSYLRGLIQFVHPMNHKIIALALIVLLGSCVSKKKYTAIKGSNETLLNKVDGLNRDLAACQKSLSEAEMRNANLQTSNDHLRDQVSEMSVTNAALLANVGNMATLSAKEAENLEKSLENIREKDLQIRRMQDALTKKDSVTLALVVALKGSLGNLADEDIQVNVEKGVVFISINDNVLFKSGSTTINDKAKPVLAKVAQVVNNRPDMEFLVEGHTDDVPISRDCYKDNWDLSVLRATSIVRLLQKDFNVDPARMTAGGRSQYVPLVANDSAENKARNRRTRIVVLPKMDEFYKMIEDGMKEAGE